MAIYNIDSIEKIKHKLTFGFMPNLGQIMRPSDDGHLGLCDNETVERRICAFFHVNVPLLPLVLQRVAATAFACGIPYENFIKECKAG